MSADYCDLCDLPLATCVHGMPPAPSAVTRTPPPKASKPVVRKKAAATSSGSSGSSASTRTVTRRWTPPDALKPHILAVLEDADGDLPSEDVFAALEERLDSTLLAGDRETTPEGELRWQYAARRARQLLLQEGLMVKGRPGVWELADSSG